MHHPALEDKASGELYCMIVAMLVCFNNSLLTYMHVREGTPSSRYRP